MDSDDGAGVKHNKDRVKKNLTSNFGDDIPKKKVSHSFYFKGYWQSPYPKCV